MIFNEEAIAGRIDSRDYDELKYLIDVLRRTASKNKLRADYYDLHNRLKDLGISIPPRFRELGAVVGWPAKAVDHLARRIRFESFTLPSDTASLESFGIEDTWGDNNMEMDLPQGIASSLIHSPAFILTLPGDTDMGEPDIVVSTFDALHATGRWNWSRRGLDSALVITDTVDGTATRMLFFHGRKMYDFRRHVKPSPLLVPAAYGESWEWEITEDIGINRVPVEPLIYRPRTARPFGSSRITPAVRYITDGGIRTLVRTELNAEFFSTPQRYLFNVEEEDLYADGKTQWDVIIGKMLTMGMPENPEDPDPVAGQFPQISMQPNIEMLRMWATLMSGETGIPVGSLGVIQDNPSSAEAIYANKEDLVLEAEEANRSYTGPLRRTAENIVMLRGGLSTPPEELRRLGVRWIDPSTPSRNQSTDTVMKQVAGGVLPAGSEVTLELLGYSPDVIERIMADRRRDAARETIRAALAVNVDQTPEDVAADKPFATKVKEPQDQSVAEYREQNNLTQ